MVNAQSSVGIVPVIELEKKEKILNHNYIDDCNSYETTHLYHFDAEAKAFFEIHYRPPILRNDLYYDDVADSHYSLVGKHFHLIELIQLKKLFSFYLRYAAGSYHSFV